MLSSDKNTEAITRLLSNARTYGEMKLDAFERSSVSKLSALISGLVIGAIVFAVAFFIILAASIALVAVLAPHVGGVLPALLFVAMGYTIVGIIIFACRRTLIVHPVERMLARLFFETPDAAPRFTAQQVEDVRKAMADDYSTLTAPPKPARNRMERFVNAATQSWNIVDGAILGYKLYRQFRRFGRRKK